MLDYLALACLFAPALATSSHQGMRRNQECWGWLDDMMDSKWPNQQPLNEVAELLAVRWRIGCRHHLLRQESAGHTRTFLNNKMAMSDEHASTEAERAIRSEILDSTTTTFSQDDERSEHSTEPIGA